MEGKIITKADGSPLLAGDLRPGMKYEVDLQTGRIVDGEARNRRERRAWYAKQRADEKRFGRSVKNHFATLHVRPANGE